MVEHFIIEKQKIEESIRRLERRTNLLSWIRLITFVIAFVGIVLGVTDHYRMVLGIGLFFAMLFFFLVFYFHEFQEKLSYERAMGQVLDRYIARFSNDWKKFPDIGEDFLTGEQVTYREEASDLDIFGPSSLFQYMNAAVSPGGRNRLREWLTGALGDSAGLKESIGSIENRQQAVQELREKEKYSLRLEALAQKMGKQDLRGSLRFFAELSENASKEKKQAVWIGVLAGASILVTIITLLLACCQRIDFQWFVCMLVVQLIVSQAVDGIVVGKSAGVFSYLRYLSEYRDFLQAMTEEKMESGILAELQAEVKKDSQKGMKRLQVIGEALQFRHNPIVYGILCMVCFYNVFVYLAFVNWTGKYAHRVDAWVECVSEMEALLSLAVIARTRSTVSYPQICESGEPFVDMTQMCHPLLLEREVVGNDVLLENQIRLITGSNMSGKTTYLRTLGVNLVLAYAGAPVCATGCRISQMQLFTSMRVVDDVGQGISTFYAEVLRIQKMITFSRKEIPMLVLIDEIFKGTNSADRIVGAKGVIQALCLKWVNGMVSTHDFELCQLSEEQPMLENYHFDEYFEEDQLKFEYRVKEGRCRTTNALHILKMAGITETE